LFAVALGPSVGCLSDDADEMPSDDDGIYSEHASEIAIPGAWNPPPFVRDAGRSQYVPYQGPPPWNGGANCGGSLLAGTRQLGDFIKATFPGRVTSYGGYACRPNTANASQTSVHGTGRALDLFVPLAGGQADNTKGDEVANWLVMNAGAIGVQYVIWDRTDWSGHRGGDKVGGYGGPHPHHDHLHVELTHAGANRLTPWFNGAPAAVQVGRSGDFNGDGKTDVITFTRGAGADVFVSLSTGNGFLGASIWHEYWAPGVPNAEIPSVGDFNGDGKDDIVTFTRGNDRGDVLVALSNGGSFAGPHLWHDWFAPGGEIPTVGDFNGDGKDDIITFTRGESGDVFVGLSTGNGFVVSKWHDFFSIRGELPAVGDFNGDGKDDIATFTRGEGGDVHVALSNGSAFVCAGLWHDFFSIHGELPTVGDFNGDGRDDIATFTRGAGGDVHVALSTGGGFAYSGVWHDYFSIHAEVPGAGDFDGDGKADIVTFTRGDRADAIVSRSTGAGFGPSAVWNDFFAPFTETPMPGVIVF
jgi:hypothetical protein